MGRPERIASIVQEFDAQGWHRTGSESDIASAHWLLEKVHEHGLEAALEQVDLSRIDPQDCFLESESRRIIGLPLFDGGFTDSDGIRGRIGPLGSEAEIGFVKATPGELAGAFEVERKLPAHIAYVALTQGGRPGLAVSNAPRFLNPFGPPVLQISSEEGDWIAELAHRGSSAHLVASTTRSQAKSYNVVAQIQGRNSHLNPLVVMTPRSGWWHCAAERGGGLACWLEVIERLSNEECLRNVLFVATTGHELGLLGVRAFLEQRPDLIKSSEYWLHFGASIGAAHDASPRLGASDSELEAAAQSALTHHNAPQLSLSPRGTMVGAESNVVYQLGARCVAMAGPHALFHMEADRWPDAVDLEALTSYATAFADLAYELAKVATSEDEV